MNKMEGLDEEIKACAKCELCKTRTQAVPGDGNYNADIVFVGEAPGKKEDEKGIPFVGSAGKMLDKMLESISLERKDVYITNIVKCRPPENRDPKDEEKEVCSEYLMKQLKAMNVKLVVTLGRHSMNFFLPECKMSEDHGKPKNIKGQVYLPLYHPAAALYNSALRETLFEDFKLIPKILKNIQ